MTQPTFARQSSPVPNSRTPVRAYLSYAPADQLLADQLDRALAGLRHEGLLITWDRRHLTGGELTAATAAQQLQEAELLVVLLSADYLHEQECYKEEFQRGQELADKGCLRLLPVMVRPVDYTVPPRSKEALIVPAGGSVVTAVQRDDAWVAVVGTVRAAVDQIHRSRAETEQGLAMRLARALAEAFATPELMREFCFNAGLPTAVDGESCWTQVVQRVVAGHTALTPFDLAARAVQQRPHDAKLWRLRAELQKAQPQPAVLRPSVVPAPQADLPGSLRGLAEGLHGSAARQAAAYLQQGRYVALLAPSGFGVRRCLRAVLELCMRQGALVHCLTPLCQAPDLDTYLDDLERQLAHVLFLPKVDARKDRKLVFLDRLREGLHDLARQGRRLVLGLDEVERFGESYRERLVTLLGVLAQLYEERPQAAPENLGVVLPGGEALYELLRGPHYFRGMSVFRAEEIVLAVAPCPDAPRALRRVVKEVGGHPELLLWAADHGGHTDGNPEDEIPTLREQVQRFRSPPHRERLRGLLEGRAEVWRSPGPALRWSGWLRDGGGERGWLSSILEQVARRTVELP